MSLEQRMVVSQSVTDNVQRARAASVRAKLSYAGATVSGLATLADVGYYLGSDSATEKAAGVVAGVIFIAGAVAGGISGRKQGKESAQFRRTANTERRKKALQSKGKKLVAPADQVFGEYYGYGNGRHR